MIIFITIIITLTLIIDIDGFFKSIILTLNTWLYKIFPAIFTFYIISSILINTKTIHKITYIFRFVFKNLKFNTNYELQLFLVSIFVGNPASSSLIIEGYNSNNISINNANNLLKYSSFFNILSLITLLKTLGSKYITIIIIIHLLSNFLIAYISNKKNEKTIISNCKVDFSINQFITSLNNSIYLLLSIAIIIVFFNMIIYSFTTTLNFFNINNLIINISLSFFEISYGLNNIVNLNINMLLKLILINLLISFNGLCIHMQVYNLIYEKLKYKLFLKYRIIQGIIASIIFSIIYLIFW